VRALDVEGGPPNPRFYFQQTVRRNYSAGKVFGTYFMVFVILSVLGLMAVTALWVYRGVTTSQWGGWVLPVCGGFLIGLAVLLNHFDSKRW
jgi:threonine/homoserine/homoserine lactone efflux protein